MKNFCTAHSHPQSLDSGSTCAAMAKREVELGTGCLCATDHGTLGAARTIYDLARKNKLTPILGLEAYVRDDNDPILLADGMQRDEGGTFSNYLKYMHLTLHALDQQGYEAMVRVLSRADLTRGEQHGSERKPIFNWADLEELGSYNVSTGSGCLIGLVQRHLIGDRPRPDLAVKYYEKLRSTFKLGNTYIEVFPHSVSTNWVKAVYLELADTDGQKPPDRRFKFSKMLRVRIDQEVVELAAYELAVKFDKWNGRVGPPVTLLATKHYQTWTDEAAPASIIFARTVEAFLANECTAFAPDGALQTAANKFMLGLAAKYKDPVLISDDSHFAYPEERIVQDLRMLSGEGGKTKGSNASWRFSECFEGGTLVDMADGTRRPISDIRAGDEVLSYDFSLARVVSARVVAQLPTPAVKASFVAHRFSGQGTPRVKARVVSTPNHCFWTGSNWGEVASTQVFSVRAPKPSLALLEALQGTLLGDGSVSLAGRERKIAYYSYGHTAKQRGLTEDIAQALGKRVNASWPKGGFTSNEKFQTNSAHPIFVALREQWYPTGRKIVPSSLKLTPRMLAWWFMDDGSRCVGSNRNGKPRQTPLEQFRLYTNGFDVADVDYLISELARLGVPARRYSYTKGQWFIAFRKGASQKFQEMIAPFVLPCAEYKLSPEYRGRYCNRATPGFDGEDVYPTAHKKEVEVGIRRWERTYPNAFGRKLDWSTKYDIEVEGHHCFFVEGLLVHNSYHRQTSAEAFEHFKSTISVPEAVFAKWVDNSYQFRDRFGWKFQDRKQLPTKFYPANTVEHTLKLIGEVGRMDWTNATWKQRLMDEMKMLNQNGVIDLLPYFFLAQDGIKHYEAQGHLPGPGRGSAAGMLLAYLLGITHVEPQRYGLSKERFLTTSRVRSGKLPDIDMDFGKKTRAIIVDPKTGWLKQRFGDHCAQISTDTMLRLKSSIQDTHRMLDGQVSPAIWSLTEKLQLPPQGVSDHNFVYGYNDADGMPVPGSIETDPVLKDYVAKYPKHWDIVSKALGVIKNKGRHASAYCVANTPISNFIPTTLIGGNVCTSYNMKGVEAAGGIKMDYLGISTLDDLEVAIHLVQERSGATIPDSLIVNGKKVPAMRLIPVKKDDGWNFYDVWDLPEDQPVFNDITSGKTNKSVFQFGCLTDDVEALTKRGWVRGFNLVEGDVLLTKNSGTGILEWQAATEIRLYPNHVGQLTRIKNSTFDVTTTPNHRWLVTSQRGIVQEKTTETLSLGQDRIHLTGNYDSQIEGGLTPDEAELLGWFVTDGHYETHKTCDNSKKSKNFVSGKYALLTQSPTYNAAKCERIDTLISRLDALRESSSYINTNNKTGTQQKRWRLGARLTKLMLCWAPDRHLTVGALLRLNSAALKRLREGMWLGDGWKYGDSWGFVTGKEEQAHAFQMLLTLTGLSSTIRRRNSSKYGPKVIENHITNTHNDTWEIHAKIRHYAQPRKTHVMTYMSTERVWCPVVPNTFFVARSKGRVFVTGNTPAAQQWLKEFSNPDGVSTIKSIEDLAAFTALDRPGGLDSFVETRSGVKRNMLQEFAARAAGKDACLGRLAILDELFPETYGVLTYQEQLQKAFTVIGGTTAEEGDEFRVHVSKKMAEKVMADKAVFMKGAIARLGEQDAERMWNQMESFAAYGFNKSHAVCYTVIGYACAWFQHHFPLEWWTSVLSNADRNEIDSTFWVHAGHLVDRPDVKLSGEEFEIQGERIRAPMRLLVGVGPTAHEEMVAGRPYADLRDFLQRIKDKKAPDKDGKKGRSNINRGVLTKLIVSGCADALFPEDKRGDVFTRLSYFEQVEAEVNNRRYKKTGELKTQPVDPRFLGLSPIQRFLLTKSVLPSFTQPLADLVASMGRKDVRVDARRFSWLAPEPFEGQRWTPIVPGSTIRSIFDGKTPGIPPKWRFACIAYVSESKPFWGGKALKVNFEVDGERFEVNAWPKTVWKDGEKTRVSVKLPSGVQGGVAILSFSRWDIEKSFSIDDVCLITPAFTLKLAEESA